MTFGRFREICQVGDRFLTDRLGIIAPVLDSVRYVAPDVLMRSVFDEAFDDFTEAECTDWTALELMVLRNYALAAAGLRAYIERAGVQQEAWWQR